MRAVRLAPHGRQVRVGLVVDLADEFLDEVLHRDDAGDAAVLVDDDRHLCPRIWSSRIAVEDRAASGNTGASSDSVATGASPPSSS